MSYHSLLHGNPSTAGRSEFEESANRRVIKWSTALSEQRWGAVLFLTLILIVQIIIAQSTKPHSFAFLPTDPSISFPHTNETIPAWGLAVLLGVCAALCVFVEISMVDIVHETRTQATWQGVFVMVDLVCATCMTMCLCQLAKYGVGRPRPDFLARCMLPDQYKNSTQWLFSDVHCTNPNRALLKEGEVSYFSGHSATSFTYASYVTLYLLWTLYLRPRRSKSGSYSRLAGEIIECLRICALFIPFLVAGFIASSRIYDYRHHVSDVVAGAFVGSVVGSIFFIRGVSLIRRMYPGSNLLMIDYTYPL